MTKEGFARLAFEARHNAEHGEGGWEAWDAAGQIERGEWLPVGSLIEELTCKAVRDAGRTDESEPAKVIVVIDDGGGEHRYAVPTIGQTHDGALILGERQDDDSVLVSVTYPPGRWKRAFIEGTEVDGMQAKALRLQSALRKIAMAEVYGDDAEALQDLARECLKGTGWDGDDL